MEQIKLDSTRVQEVNIYPYKGTYPKIDSGVVIFPGARIIGEVEIGKGSSVWYNSVIRGDVNYVKIGELTNIQDGSILHVTGEGFPLVIGNKVTIGHNAVLHACTIEDHCLIGMGAILLDGAVISKFSMIAAGAVVPPNLLTESYKLYAGIPAKPVRNLTKDEIDYFEISAVKYNRLALESFNELISL